MNLTPPKFAIQLKKCFLRIQKCKNNPLITKNAQKCPKTLKNTFKGLKSIHNITLTCTVFIVTNHKAAEGKVRSLQYYKMHLQGRR